MGGTTGYLMGRRTSRIKSEASYIPVQKKLEQKIVEIGNTLADKETVIRKLARQNAVIANSVNHERTTYKPVEQKPALKASEHLGHFIIESDKVVFDRPSKPQEDKIAVKPETKSEKHIDTFSRTELLAISQKIIVDGTSLRQIYEAHLVGERGLRRLVKEHLRGGNVKKALKREIVERQIDFERDPIVRDKAYTEVARQESSGAKLETIIQKVDNSIPYVDSGTLSFEPKTKPAPPKESRNNTLDMAFVGIIFMLTATIIFLLLKGY
jgi:hypothetical protein